MPNYVRGIGPLQPKIFIVAEAPGKDEDAAGIPLVGETGQETQRIYESAGGKWSQLYKTNVVKYRPPMNDFTKLGLIGVDLDQQINDLWEKEIRPYKPNVIIAMGDRALHAVCDIKSFDKKGNPSGILNYRGSILLAKDNITKVVPTVHVANLLWSNKREGFKSDDEDEHKGLPYVYRQLIKHDMQRAIEESYSPELRLPIRQLDIAHSSLDVYKFFAEYRDYNRPAVDIESINCIPVCIGFAFTPHHSLTIPLITKIGDHKLTDMGPLEVAECWKIIIQELDRLELVGQNFKYDEFKCNLLGIHNMNLKSDTLLKTRLIWPELPVKKFHVQSSIWTREPFYKEEGKEAKIGKRFNVEQFFKYCGKDCCCEKEVDLAQEVDLIKMQDHFKLPLVDFYYNNMMKRHKFYLKMEQVGFRVDFDKKRSLKKEYTEMHGKVHKELEELVGHEINTKSTPQIYMLLYKEMKFRALRKNPTSEDAIVRLMANHCKGEHANRNRKILEKILEDRRIRDQISRQINFVADFDYRCKTSVSICGTETGRSTTSVLKKPLRPTKIGLSFHTISKHGKLGKDIRSMFIPDEGYIFLVVDASQAEPRIVAVLSEDWELLNAMNSGVVDIHRRTAAMLFGYTPGLQLVGPCPVADRMEKDGPERYTGKTVRNAGNYDVQKGTLMETFNTNAQKYEIDAVISEWKAGQMLERFHQASPKTKSIFHRDIKLALDSTRVLINPFGRPRTFYGRQNEDLYKEGYAQIPQSTVGDLVQTAAVKISEECDTEIMFNSENHDALVMSVPIKEWEKYARVAKKYMETPIDFSQYCTLKRDYKLIIPCDAEISMTPDGRVTNYADLRKVKVA